MSALLFILVAEILAINIQCNKSIKGIVVNDTEFKISQLADDTSLFLRDHRSLTQVIELLDEFAICSGLKLNKTKTEIFYLGNTNHRPNVDVNDTYKVSTSFKLLGIHFGVDQNNISQNLEERYKCFKTILNIWSQRDLSIKGKITIIKSFTISQ